MKRKILKMLLTGLLVLSMGLGACRSGEDGNFSSSDSSPRDSFSQISSSSRTDSSSALPDVSAVVFADFSCVYDGQVHTITVSGLPAGVEAVYENNKAKDAGTYRATAKLYAGEKQIDTLTATLKIEKREAKVVIDDQASMLEDVKELTFTVEGALEGDELNIELSVEKTESGVKQIRGTYSNKNYTVTFSGGEYVFSEYLFDSSDMKNYSAPFLPGYAPFALYDTSVFSGAVITSISFPYSGLAGGYTADSPNLYMPVYVVKSDFSTPQSECTVENGKKINLDFTGKLGGVSAGDWLTADNLHIEVGTEETLAFGDAQMAVLPMFLRDNAAYGFWNRIFGTKGQNNHSLIFKIAGYKAKAKETADATYISFLGDSISTYAGWSNNGKYNATISSNAVWFPNSNYTGADMAVEKTWWYQTVKALDYALCVNNSWSGSQVTTSQTYNVRAKNLHNALGQAPDVVVILMGVNDYAAGAAVGNYDGAFAPPLSPGNFSEAYGRTVANILDAYEGVEIYCCTFLPDRKRFSGSVNQNGIEESAYNESIKKIAGNMGVNLIDLYADSGITPQTISAYTVDRLHPNAAGMQRMSNIVAEALRNGQTGKNAA